MHITMFKFKKGAEPIRCVIAADFKADFESLGFVDHIDKVKSPKKKAAKDGD